MGKRRYSSTILKPGTKQRKVVSFTHLPLYPHEDSPRYPLDRTLSGPTDGLEVTKKIYIYP
jgi:hypothetical protein